MMALARRELLRFWRERTRVAGFVVAPLLFWFVTSSGFGDFNRFYSGSLALTLMFSAIFANMSLIEDRREGFLLGVLVTRAPRWSVVAGKILGASLLAWSQALMFLAFLPFTAFRPPWTAVAAVIPSLFAIAFAFTALGFLIAWKLNSVQGFHAIINLLLVPLWMTSGALFPIRTADAWLQWAMRLNPMTYAMALIERLLNPAADALLPSVPVSAAVTLVLGAVLFAGAVRLAREGE
jgi:ABC-2 type transport system permease protein